MKSNIEEVIRCETVLQQYAESLKRRNLVDEEVSNSLNSR